MQITNTTDYALRIMDYLSEKGNLATEAELADNLKIPIRNISKIMNILKNNNLINSEMGFNGGYSLAKNLERISYFDVISATESSMNLNKCLERNGVCSRNCIETCNVRKVLLKVQEDINQNLKNITFENSFNQSEIIEKRYLLLKVDLNSLDMNIISIKSKFSDLFNNYMTYDEFLYKFINHCVSKEDRDRVKSFLINFKNSEKYYQDSKVKYRSEDGKTWMDLDKHIDDTQMVLMFKSYEYIYENQDKTNISYLQQDMMIVNEFWNMVSLLETVLAHNKLEDHESLHNISFFTEQIYKELQLNFPEYGILDNEIENISKLATIHDIGKISTPYEVLNKKGKLTKEEMDIVKKHPEDGANMALKLPKCNSTKKLVHYAYNICLYHHERYDGHGYPKGLKSDDIPLEAQVVGLADAYDALISERPYKRKINHGEAVRMIVNGECGSFSPKVILSFIIASMNKTWIEKVSK